MWTTIQPTIRSCSRRCKTYESRARFRTGWHSITSRECRKGRFCKTSIKILRPCLGPRLAVCRKEVVQRLLGGRRRLCRDCRRIFFGKILRLVPLCLGIGSYQIDSPGIFGKRWECRYMIGFSENCNYHDGLDTDKMIEYQLLRYITSETLQSPQYFGGR